MKSGIAIEVIYVDVHLIELQVSASNTMFSGQIDSYVNHDAAAELSNALKGFPRGVDDFRQIELGSNASFTFSTVDELGHSMVGVDIASNVLGPNGFSGKATFNILINPAEIDQFVDELAALKPELGQSAILKGS